ncbi:riboflavin biosynthesis protein RibF [Deinococcus peraridilitoris]|uniref:Riboflavin biosynthesis protein n=1 Tax=Deinococcus peraridilitoris (strain DSM 19664 / LMG 22246 / CIP 109416 / KR-200) TaxID=937777 RepID=K9ZY04_DEIPD|nr:riboflavin biosynthesis protein RibF [Deinococcus peraridilitoris]AFZ65807.1 riboflavin kinase/FMN adenylyltransferase [Deinococcus peraridilitoris DSM 19664]
MKTYQSPQQRPDTDTVVAIGSFDGVHLGHQALIKTLRERARFYRVPSVVYTFDPPTRVLTQGALYLSTLPEKLALLERFGVDEVIAVSFTREFASRTKEEFLGDIAVLRPRAIVVGEDFGFGKGRAGKLDDLRTVTPELDALPMFQLTGKDIKSSRIRELLLRGDVEGAGQFLGRTYDAVGVVVSGDKLGRTIGFPTANVKVPNGKLLPSGVFAVTLWVSGQRLAGMANVGMRPTVDGTDTRLEVHAFDFDGDLYGEEVQVKFEYSLRGEQKFASLDELKAQLARDQARARELLVR